jgi:hypothetical protein
VLLSYGSVAFQSVDLPSFFILIFMSFIFSHCFNTYISIFHFLSTFLLFILYLHFHFLFLHFCAINLSVYLCFLFLSFLVSLFLSFSLSFNFFPLFHLFITLITDVSKARSSRAAESGLGEKKVFRSSPYPPTPTPARADHLKVF